jgi:heat shock protein HslJ
VDAHVPQRARLGARVVRRWLAALTVLVAGCASTGDAPPREVTGMFVYRADAATITLCDSAQRLPVAMEGDHLALERAYRAASAGAGMPLLVSLEGAVEPRAGGYALVVKRFTGLWPRETCGQPLVRSPLRGTYWKLTRLNGTAVQWAANLREPHLLLAADDMRVTGSGGCNRLAGGFELSGSVLHFTGIAGTRMACPEGMAQEQAFVQALEKSARHAIRGSHLELLDAQGAMLARFEAVASK